MFNNVYFELNNVYFEHVGSNNKQIFHHIIEQLLSKDVGPYKFQWAPKF